MCKCYATLSSDDPRYEIWMQVDPAGIMPLKHPLLVKNRHFPNALFYVGDAERLSRAQKKKMASLMAKKFKISEEEVLHNLATGEFHIRSDNIHVTICELHVRCMI